MKCTVKQSERIASYKTCCDFVYANDGRLPTNGVFSVWCHTHHLQSLLELIKNHTDRNSSYVIVSHASDFGITKNITDLIPDNVYKLFSQNVAYKHDKVESIPIGSIACTWIGEDQYATKHQDDGSYCYDYAIIPETEEEKKNNLVLMDFSVNSSTYRRLPVYNHFKDKEWVTRNPCTLAHSDHEKTEFNKIENYLRGIYNHKFIVSPLGNGEDCGRNWQALYLGTIPIIPRHTNIEYYEKELPFLIYDDINTITEDFLNEKWKEITSKTYNLEKATISYWKTRIKNAKIKR